MQDASFITSKIPVRHVLHLFFNANSKVSAQPHLDLLSGDGLQLSLLSDGEDVDKDLCPSCDRHFEVIASLLDLGDALDIFALLDEVIRET